MCGIIGAIGKTTENMGICMLSQIDHRGPDDWGIEIGDEKDWMLGHKRLSIIDLSPAGHQPMWDKDKELVIVFNGEIYNYLEIKEELFKDGFSFSSNSDTEVILYAYKKWGEDCLHKFNGMFAFAIYDVKRKKLFAARDRLGIKPFYYYYQNNVLVFASEIKAFLASGMVEKEPDYDAITTPTRYQITPNTGFKNIFKLGAGEQMVLSNGKLALKKYWDISPTENIVNYNEVFETVDSLLNSSVKMQMIADVPVGLFLSGGLDSSIIAALMRKNSNEDIHSFTIKFSDADQKYEKQIDDSYYAKKVAGIFGFKHHELCIEPNIVDLLPKLVWHLDEPLADPACINTYLMSKSARDQGIVVILNGMGGDEVFGGYRKHLACLTSNYYQRFLPNILRDEIQNAINNVTISNDEQGYKYKRWLKRFLSFASLSKIDRFLSSDLSLGKTEFENLYSREVIYENSNYFTHNQKLFNRFDVSYLTKMCLLDTKIMLPEHNLTYSDKSTMAASIEGRPPLIDHRIVEYMFTLPPSYRIRHFNQKYILKKVAEKYLPKEIVCRPKAPFSAPIRSWMKGPLKKMVDDRLSEAEINKWGLYNYKSVASIIQNDRIGLEDNAQLIWQLLTTQIWLETFFTKV